MVHQNKKICHHLLVFMSFQTWMTFFLLHNIKEGILKTVGNTAVLITSEEITDVSLIIFFYVL